MRVVTVDETGLLKVVRLESGEVLATGGPQGREHAVGGACYFVTDGGDLDCTQLFVARRHSGVVESWQWHAAAKPAAAKAGAVDTAAGGGTLLRVSSSAPGCVKGSLGLEMAGSTSRLASCSDDGNIAVFRLEDKGLTDAAAATAEFRVNGPISAMCSGGSGTTARLACGGRENGVKTFDLETQQCVYRSKNLPHDSLDLAPPLWVTVVEPLAAAGSKEGPNPLDRLVTGTAYGQLRLYDARAGRRPYQAINEASQHRITALLPSPDGHDAVVGDAAGELHAFDLRTLRRRRRFAGPAGSIRALSAHPKMDLGVFACAGLDRMVRAYENESAAPRGQVYLRQRLTHVLFADEGPVAVSGGGSTSASGGSGSGVSVEGEEGLEDVLGSEEEYDMGEMADAASSGSDSGEDMAGDDGSGSESEGDGDIVAARSGRSKGAAAGGAGAAAAAAAAAAATAAAAADASSEEEDGDEEAESSDAEDGREIDSDEDESGNDVAATAVAGKRPGRAAAAAPSALKAQHFKDSAAALAAARERFKRTRHN